jgi:hypothetical protein
MSQVKFTPQLLAPAEIWHEEDAGYKLPSIGDVSEIAN